MLLTMLFSHDNNVVTALATSETATRGIVGLFLGTLSEYSEILACEGEINNKHYQTGVVYSSE